MKSSAQKGKDFQNFCATLLLELFPDSVCHNQVPVAKAIPIKDPKTGKIEVRWVSHRNDIFGCVDIIWMRPKQIAWIQCTMDTNLKKKIKDLSAVPWPPQETVELWVKRGPGKVDIYRYWEGGLVMTAKIAGRKIFYA